MIKNECDAESKFSYVYATQIENNRKILIGQILKRKKDKCVIVVANKRQRETSKEKNSDRKIKKQERVRKNIGDKEGNEVYGEVR